MSDRQAVVKSIQEFIPDTNAGKCIHYCFGELGLSVEETCRVLYDATKIAQAIQVITDGALTSELLASRD